MTPSVEDYSSRRRNFVGFRGAQDYIASLGTCTATLG